MRSLKIERTIFIYLYSVCLGHSDSPCLSRTTSHQHFRSEFFSFKKNWTFWFFSFIMPRALPLAILRCTTSHQHLRNDLVGPCKVIGQYLLLCSVPRRSDSPGFTARRRISISRMTFCSLKKQLSNIYLSLSSVPRALRHAMLHLAHLQPHANTARSGGGSGRGSFSGGGNGGGSSSGGSEVHTHMYMHTGATTTNAEARAQKIEEWRRPKFWAGFLVLGSRTCLPGPANVSWRITYDAICNVCK